MESTNVSNDRKLVLPIGYKAKNDTESFGDQY